jgi:hypothetical protein
MIHSDIYFADELAVPPKPLSMEEKIAAFTQAALGLLQENGMSGWGEKMWMGQDIPEKVIKSLQKKQDLESWGKPLLVKVYHSGLLGMTDGLWLTTWGVHQRYADFQKIDPFKACNFDISWLEYNKFQFEVTEPAPNETSYDEWIMGDDGVRGTIKIIWVGRDANGQPYSTLPLYTVLYKLIPQVARIFGA